MSEIILKILLIGDTSVGKTSLLIKYTEDNFSENHITTIGVECVDKQITINDRKVTLQIWDTSGQERFKSITKNFYQNANGIIFVFDITNENSFEHLKDWLDNSEQFAKDFKKLIVGNKNDLEDQRVIKKERIEHFANEREIKCFETSAKNGINVERIFQEIGELIMENKTEKEIEEEYSADRPRSRSILSKDVQKEGMKRRCC